jgi:hypothetical protein
MSAKESCLTLTHPTVRKDYNNFHDNNKYDSTSIDPNDFRDLDDLDDLASITIGNDLLDLRKGEERRD